MQVSVKPGSVAVKSHLNAQSRRTTNCSYCGDSTAAANRKYCPPCQQRSKLSYEPVAPRISAIFGETIDLVGKNIEFFVLAPLLQIFIMLIPLSMIFTATTFWLEKNQGIGIETRSLVSTLAFLLGCLVWQIGASSRIRVCLRMAQGERVQIRDVLSIPKLSIRSFGHFAIKCTYHVVWFIGLVVMILPGIMVMVRFWPMRLMIIDENRPALQTALDSFKLTNRKLFTNIQVFIVYYVLLLLSLPLFLVGLFYAFWVTDVLFSVAYLSMKTDHIMSEQNRSDLWGSAGDLRRSD